MCLDIGFETLNLKVCELELWELTVWGSWRVFERRSVAAGCRADAPTLTLVCKSSTYCVGVWNDMIIPLYVRVSLSLSIYIYIIIYNYIYRWYMSCHVSYVIHHTSYIICHLSYTIACHVMSCHVMSCHIMSCHVMSCHVMMYIMTYFIVSYRICPSVCAPLVSKNLPESSPLKSRFLVCGLAVYYRCLWRKLPFCAHRVYYVFCHHWMHLTILTNGQSASNHS